MYMCVKKYVKDHTVEKVKNKIKLWLEKKGA